MHVLDVDVFSRWLAGEAAAMSYSWSITLLAAATSLESGVALVCVYRLLYDKLPAGGVWRRGLLVAALGLATQGRLLRSLVMNLAVGGWHAETLLAAGRPWLVWLAMGLTLAAGYERLIARRASL
ncbi:hypothetical protein CEK28_06650 [Xenophilus sp. AP218F]|nr:hypothetical protein CEK28_06650 [Xenophilus sp. AP218F]